MRRGRFALLAAAIAVATASCGSAAGGGATVAARAHDPLCNFSAQPPAVYKHVIWIWFENTDEQDVVSQSNAGTFTSDLLDRCALATNYHNITHPSLPNYISPTSGAVQGQAAVTDCAPADCPQSQQSIFDQVHASGGQWREYLQSAQGTCGGGTAAFYPSLASQCAGSVVALGDPASGSLQADLAAGTLPEFAFVRPDASDDAGPSADAFLDAVITSIMGSATYKQGSTAILVTWDEGGTDRTAGEQCDDSTHAVGTAYPGCQVAFIAVGPAVGQARSDEYFTHYSLLRTTEEMLGISTYLGAAAKAHSMRAALHL